VPELSARRLAFIQEHPELADPANHEAVMSYVRQAQRMGIENEAEVDRYVLQGLTFELAARTPRRQEPEPEPMHQPQARQEEAFQEPPPEPRRSLPAPEPARRSMPMAAPVSRSEAPSYSGKRTSNNSLRLTEEERKVARDSIPDRPDAPRYTDAQKEYIYAQNKAKYEQMLRDGTYSEQRQR
jgi:hypothetical protein